MRLIDADALLKNRFNLYMGFQGQMPFVAVRDIDDAPTIDPERLRTKGRWFLLDECSNAGVYCSVCQKKVYKEQYANQKLKSTYCPNCGAKMEE